MQMVTGTSVSQNVVIAMSGIAKVYVGEIVETGMSAGKSSNVSVVMIFFTAAIFKSKKLVKNVVFISEATGSDTIKILPLFFLDSHQSS